MKRFLTGVVDTIPFIGANSGPAQAAANQQLTSLGSALAPATLSAAWSDLTFTADPLAASLQKEAADAVAVGLLDGAQARRDLRLDIAQQVLRGKGHTEVSST